MEKLTFLCRPQAVLAESVQKIFKVDDHIGMFYAGLTVDGNSTATYVSC